MSDEIPGEPPVLDNENTGEPEVVASHIGGGWYKISAPWMEEPEKVQGADDAKARVAELVAEGDPDDSRNGQEAAPGTGHNPPKEYRGTLTKAQKKAKGMPKMTRIILEENEEIPPTGLFLGHNGRGYMILPSVEVDVPDFLIEILDHARKMTPIVDPSTKRVEGWRERPRYPYRRV